MEKQYRIDISPEILELLGPSLYTNIYYVLAELIANAYDADARNVYIIVEDDAVIVEDDGRGMSYENGVQRYLQVAKPTRVNSADDLTPQLKRRRMGRKGVGKLAALSVSERVSVMTRSDKDVSGFVLSRIVPPTHTLEPIPDDRIKFRKIDGTGTSIIMTNPEYSLHKTLDAWRRNISRMFPVISNDFKIHLEIGGRSEVVDTFDKNIIPQLSTLITCGSDYKHLEKFFDAKYPDIKDKVCLHIPDGAIGTTIEMLNSHGDLQACEIDIRGWIGTYVTTTGRKKNIDDFPDNYLSIFANGKLGAFNIIPEIGRNRMSESYIVGQLHIDAFEDTSFPDMAMSNRQGYKTGDPRYKSALEIIRDDLFTKIINMRDVYTARKKQEKDRTDRRRQKEAEDELKERANEFSERVSRDIAAQISLNAGSDFPQEAKRVVNENLPLLGLKKTVDAGKRKLLISHAGSDKEFADILYDLLIFCGVQPDDVIYTSADNEKSWIPEGSGIFDYLREFFVESASTQMINVLFVVSEESSKRWAPVCEVGAAWVTKSGHKIFTLNGHRPSAPLDNNPEWHSCRTDADGIHMNQHNATLLRVKIKAICESLGVTPLDDASIDAYIADHVTVE